MTITAIADERSAGFFALGQARASGQPSVLICTSGSAVGHYLPAVMEAAATRTPLLVLSANRPLERENCEAPQTTDQRRAFGSHARGFFEIGVADSGRRCLRAVARTVSQAVALSQWPTAGAVQVDVRARKPLEPPTDSRECVDDLIASPTIAQPRTQIEESSLGVLAKRLAQAQRPLLVAGPGPLSQTTLEESVRRCLALGIPTAFELSSQLAHLNAFPGLSTVLQSRVAREGLRPDLVVQLGTAPVSSGWEPWIESLVESGTKHWVLSAGGFPDPVSTASHVLSGDLESALGTLGEALSVQQQVGASARANWCALLERLSLRTQSELNAWLSRAGVGDDTRPREVEVARAVCGELDQGAVLALGNSLAIRLAEIVPSPVKPDTRVWHQRGLNGIDGIVSGVAGSLASLAAGSGTAAPARLLIGDVSVLHDVSGLQTLSSSSCSRLAVVVIDNGGGRIFDRLPIQRTGLNEEQARLFATPPRVEFDKLARSFGLGFADVASVSALTEQLVAVNRSEDGARIIRVKTRPGQEAVDHSEWLGLLDAAMTEELTAR